MAADVKEKEAVVKTLSADEIFKVDDLKIEPVDVPEWGGRVFVRVMSAGKRDEYDASLTDQNANPNLINFRARLVAYTCCDEKGNLLFSAAKVGQLADKSSTAILTLFRTAQRLNKLGVQAVADEKKDSAAAPSGDSLTDSPSSPGPLVTG